MRHHTIVRLLYNTIVFLPVTNTVEGTVFAVMVLVMEIGTHGRPVKCPGRGVHERVSDGVIQLTCNTLFLKIQGCFIHFSYACIHVIVLMLLCEESASTGSSSDQACTSTANTMFQETLLLIRKVQVATLLVAEYGTHKAYLLELLRRGLLDILHGRCMFIW